MSLSTRYSKYSSIITEYIIFKETIIKDIDSYIEFLREGKQNKTLEVILKQTKNIYDRMISTYSSHQSDDDDITYSDDDMNNFEYEEESDKENDDIVFNGRKMYHYNSQESKDENKINALALGLSYSTDEEFLYAENNNENIEFQNLNSNNNEIMHRLELKDNNGINKQDTNLTNNYIEFQNLNSNNNGIMYQLELKDNSDITNDYIEHSKRNIYHNIAFDTVIQILFDNDINEDYNDPNVDIK